MEREQPPDIDSLKNDIKEYEKNKRNGETQVCQFQYDIKSKEHEKLLYEVKINKLKSSLNFYQHHANELQRKLHKTQEIFSQFDIADQYYTRILNSYKDTHFQQETFPETDNSIFVKDENRLDLESEVMEIQIQEHNRTIHALAKELNIV